VLIVILNFPYNKNKPENFKSLNEISGKDKWLFPLFECGFMVILFSGEGPEEDK
jgi:hypothetical protein